MSYDADSSIGPVAPVRGARPVQPVRASEPLRSARPQTSLEIGAKTGGSLPPAYAQFVVDPDSHDVVLQVKDASTHALISQYAAKEVESVATFLKQYSATMSVRHAAAQASGALR